MAGLPINVNYGTVTGKFITAEQLDTAEPDGVPVAGSVTFTASPKSIINAGAGTIILPKPVTVTLDITGSFTAQLVATDDADLQPTGWTYTVSFAFPGLSVDSFSIEVLAGTTTDLSAIVPIPDSGGTFYTQGATGAAGASAYAVAVANGFVGTEAEWIASLEGPVGPTGATGAAGTNGANGTNGVGVPIGGTTGQALIKTTATDYDTSWSTITGLPAGGTTGQILAKNSATNGDASWIIRDVKVSNTDNLAIGDLTHTAITTGASNVAVGYRSQRYMTTGSWNMAVGWAAQENMLDGGSNIGVGRSTQATATSASNNVAIGRAAHFALTTGNDNTAIGHYAGYQSAGNTANGTTTASRQVAIGKFAGASSATQADDSTAVGYSAGATTQATAIGSGAIANHTGSVAIGYGSTTTATGQIMVGARDVEITDATKGVILKAPNGTRYRVTVSNAGALVVTAA